MLINAQKSLERAEKVRRTLAPELYIEKKLEVVDVSAIREEDLIYERNPYDDPEYKFIKNYVEDPDNELPPKPINRQFNNFLNENLGERYEFKQLSQKQVIPAYDIASKEFNEFEVEEAIDKKKKIFPLNEQARANIIPKRNFEDGNRSYLFEEDHTDTLNFPNDNAPNDSSSDLVSSVDISVHEGGLVSNDSVEEISRNRRDKSNERNAANETENSQISKYLNNKKRSASEFLKYEDELPKRIQQISENILDGDVKTEKLNKKASKLEKNVEKLHVGSITETKAFKKLSVLEQKTLTEKEDPLKLFSYALPRHPLGKKEQKLPGFNHELNSFSRDLLLSDSPISLTPQTDRQTAVQATHGNNTENRAITDFDSDSERQRRDALMPEDVVINPYRIGFDEMTHILSDRIPEHELSEVLEERNLREEVLLHDYVPQAHEKNLKESSYFPSKESLSVSQASEGSDNQPQQIQYLESLRDFKRREWELRREHELGRIETTDKESNVTHKDILNDTKRTLDWLLEDLNALRTAREDSARVANNLPFEQVLENEISHRYEQKLLEILNYLVTDGSKRQLSENQLFVELRQIMENPEEYEHKFLDGYNKLHLLYTFLEDYRVIASANDEIIKSLEFEEAEKERLRILREAELSKPRYIKLYEQGTKNIRSKEVFNNSGNEKNE